MNAKRGRRIALGLVIVPIAIAIVMHFFGSDPVVIRVEGSLLHPSSATFNVQNIGVILVPAILVGIVWLACSLLVQLFAKRPQEDKNA